MSDLTTGQGPITDAAQAAMLPGAEVDTSTAPKTFAEDYVKTLRAESAAARVELRELKAAETVRQAEAAARQAADAGEVANLKERLAAAEGRAKAMEVAGVRSKAAAAHGLPADLHEFITADTEEGALAQAEKLAAKLKPATGLPKSGGRSPANGSDGAAKLDEFQRLEALAQRVPSMNNRILRG